MLLLLVVMSRFRLTKMYVLLESGDALQQFLLESGDALQQFLLESGDALQQFLLESGDVSQLFQLVPLIVAYQSGDCCVGPCLGRLESEKVTNSRELSGQHLLVYFDG